MTARRRVVAGNWKMHHGPRETEAFFRDLSLPSPESMPRLVVFPPAISIPAAAVAAARLPEVELGVQNLYWEDSGAFTGETSAAMARQAGARLALIGHSERRHLFGEEDEQVAWKIAAALRHDLVPVVCVGETLAERREGRVESVILRQLTSALGAVGSAADFMVAYEPVWAIGTGETATAEDAAAAHGTLRRRLRETGRVDADDVSILYGGSVKPGNAAELLEAEDVDGVLVGGASLDPGSFAAIVAAVSGAR